MILSLNLTAGQLVEFVEAGNFFRLMLAPNACDVRFYRNGAEIQAAEGVVAGYAEEFAESFDRFTIKSVAAIQTVQFASRQGNKVSYDASTQGSVTLSNMQGAFTQVQATVTNASGQLLAANAARRYLLIQNNDLSGDVYVTLDGTAATTAKGVKLGPGASLEVQAYCPTGAINAIGSIASNANVVVVGG